MARYLGVQTPKKVQIPRGKYVIFFHSLGYRTTLTDIFDRIYYGLCSLRSLTKLNEVILKIQKRSSVSSGKTHNLGMVKFSSK
jgi:hypothetical protein